MQIIKKVVHCQKKARRVLMVTTCQKKHWKHKNISYSKRILMYYECISYPYDYMEDKKRRLGPDARPSWDFTPSGAPHGQQHRRPRRERRPLPWRPCARRTNPWRPCRGAAGSPGHHPIVRSSDHVHAAAPLHAVPRFAIASSVPAGSRSILRQFISCLSLLSFSLLFVEKQFPRTQSYFFLGRRAT